MSTRKSRPTPTPEPAQPKSVAYPPASIWKTKEEGADFTFRGSTFARVGNHVTRVFTDANAEKPKTAPSPADDT